MGDKVLNVTGTTIPATEAFAIPFSFSIEILGNIYLVEAIVYQIDIEGQWNFISGGVGDGTFDGTIYVIICDADNDTTIDLEGHFLAVYDADLFYSYPLPSLDSKIYLYD